MLSLCSNVGKYDPNFVDAYYGPKEWKPKEENLQFDSTAYNKLVSIADSLLNELELLSEYKATELETLRYRYLYKQLFSVKARIIILNGSILPFKLESRALYDVSASYSIGRRISKGIDETR